MPQNRCCSNSYREDEESSISDSEYTGCNCKQNTYYKREREREREKERQKQCCHYKPRSCKYHTHKEKSKKSKCQDKKVIIITIS